MSNFQGFEFSPEMITPELVVTGLATALIMLAGWLLLRGTGTVLRAGYTLACDGVVWCLTPRPPMVIRPPELSERAQLLLRYVSDHQLWTRQKRAQPGAGCPQLYKDRFVCQVPAESNPHAFGVELQAGDGSLENAEILGNKVDGPWLATFQIGLFAGLPADDQKVLATAIARMVRVQKENERRTAIGLPPVYPDEVRASQLSFEGSRVTAPVADDLDSQLRAIRTAVLCGRPLNRETLLKWTKLVGELKQAAKS